MFYLVINALNVPKANNNMGNNIYKMAINVNKTNFKKRAAADKVLDKVLDKVGPEEIKEVINVMRDLASEIVDSIKGIVNIVYTPNEVTFITPEDGGIWISINAKTSGHILSAYYHPTVRHYARAIGKTDPGRSYGDPGKWAIAYAPRKKKRGQ